MKNIISSSQLAAIITIVFVFILDYYIPPGTAIGMLYLAALPMLIDNGKKTIIIFAAIISFLILENLAYFGSTRTSVYIDRALSVLSVWVVAYVIIRYGIVRDRKEGIKEQQRKALEEMLFITNHKVRHPISNMLGIAEEIEDPQHNPQEVRQLLKALYPQLKELDDFTRQLTLFMDQQKTSI